MRYQRNLIVGSALLLAVIAGIVVYWYANDRARANIKSGRTSISITNKSASCSRADNGNGSRQGAGIASSNTPGNDYQPHSTESGSIQPGDTKNQPAHADHAASRDVHAYKLPWNEPESVESKQDIKNVSGSWRDLPLWTSGKASLLGVLLREAPAETTSVRVEVFLSECNLRLRAPAQIRSARDWGATFELPLGLKFPIYIKITATTAEYEAMLTRSHVSDSFAIGQDRPLNLSAIVDARPVLAGKELPILKCVLPEGTFFAGVAAQYMTPGGAGSARTLDATLLGLSDNQGDIHLASLWCAGEIEGMGLVLHAPGFVPVIVTPEQLSAAAGGELKVIFKHRELVVKSECRLTPEQIARANQPQTPNAPQDVIPIRDPIGWTPHAVGKMYHFTLNDCPLIQPAIDAGWDFAPLEELAGRKSGDYDGDFNPQELLSWYRNQRDYNSATRCWTFVLPCHGTYAIPLAIDHDPKGNLRTPLALIIDARQGCVPSITLLSD